MIYLAIIFIGLTIGFISGLMSPRKKKPWKPKKRLFSGAEMDYGKLNFK